MAYLLLVAAIFITSFSDVDRIAELERKAANESANWEVRLDLAEIFLDQENLVEAQRYLRQAQVCFSNNAGDTCNARYFYLWAVYFDLMEQIPLAMEFYQRATNCDEIYSPGWRKLAYLYEVVAQYEKMLNCLKHALPGTTDSAEVWYEIGVTYDYLDNIKQAIEYYRLSAERDPGNSQAFLNLGADWGLLGNTDSALYYFEQAAATGLQSPELFYNMGMLKSEAGNHEEAVDAFLRTLTADPEFSPAKLQLGYSYEALGDSGMAEVYFEEFVETAPLIYLDDINVAKAKLAKYKQGR